MKNLILSVLALAAFSASAVDGKLCEAKLAGGSSVSDFKVIASNRVPEHAKVYEEYVKELTEPGGIIERLGIP